MNNKKKKKLTKNQINNGDQFSLMASISAIYLAMQNTGSVMFMRHFFLLYKLTNSNVKKMQIS